MSFWRLPITRSFVLGSILLYFVAHLALWIGACAYHQESFVGILSHYDATWYNQIIQNGYGSNEKLWAFFPLYPALVSLLYVAAGRQIPPEVLGTLLSSVFFLMSVALLFKHTKNSLLTPSTRLAWFVFLFSPASYVFHSHHTEALFLFLSLLSYRLADSQRWILASVSAGLSSMTRIPGAFLALSVGLWNASVRRFLVSGLISGAMFSLYFVYTNARTGSPWALFQAQSKWSGNGELGVMRVFRTIWFGNPSQHLGVNSMMHHPFTFFLAWGVYLVWKQNRAVALYGALCLALTLVQGEFVNNYRYGAVLFPVLFALGDRLTRQKSWILWPFAAFWLIFNGLVTAKYALLSWAY